MAKMNISVSKMRVGFGQEKKQMYVTRVDRGTITPDTGGTDCDNGEGLSFD